MLARIALIALSITSRSTLRNHQGARRRQTTALERASHVLRRFYSFAKSALVGFLGTLLVGLAIVTLVLLLV